MSSISLWSKFSENSKFARTQIFHLAHEKTDFSGTSIGRRELYNNKI